MIVLPPYDVEKNLYHQIPVEDRWIFNKLEICERFGYGPYGPCGTVMPAGTYCVRPIINVLGMANSGFYKITVEDGHFITEQAGFCWTPWNDGKRVWSEFMNDVNIASQQTDKFDPKTGLETFIEIHPSNRMKMPEQLKDISRYMLIETIGDMIIDIGPRHMPEDAKASVVADYKRHNPSWEPSEAVLIGGITDVRRIYNQRTKMYSYEFLYDNSRKWKYSK